MTICIVLFVSLYLRRLVMSSKVIEQFRQAFNNHDAGAASQMYTEDATYMLAGEPDPLRGRKAIEESYATFFRAFPDMNVEYTLTLGSGEHIFAEGIVRGTHTGPWVTPEGEIPPTNRKIELRIAFVAKVTPDGLFAEDRTYFDTATMMSQLGLGE
jgi:steroid delta-isomerase-like uncharacterized protein